MYEVRSEGFPAIPYPLGLQSSHDPVEHSDCGTLVGGGLDNFFRLRVNEGLHHGHGAFHPNYRNLSTLDSLVQSSAQNLTLRPARNVRCTRPYDHKAGKAG